MLQHKQYVDAVVESPQDLLSNRKYHSSRLCESGILTIGSYSRELERLGLGNINDSTPMKDQLAKLAKFRPTALEIDSSVVYRLYACNLFKGCPVCHIDILRAVNSIISNTLSSCTALCIDCILGTSTSPISCRINHTEPLLLPGGAGDVSSFAEWTERDMQRLHL